jgi:hypothetical protein
VISTQAWAEPKSSESYLEKLSTPDLMQTDPLAHLPYDGKPFCGPVAASNAMVWLAKNGFPRLAPTASESAFGPAAQGAIARELGLYMGTSSDHGTGPKAFIRGIEKYINAKNYQIEKIQFQGFRKVGSPYATDKDRPELDWIKSGLVGPTGVWLELGWYKRQTGTDVFSRFDGHYLTVVGFGKDAEGTLNPHVLIVHDPSVTSGIKPHDDYLILKKMISGTLITGRKNPQKKDASTFQYVVSGLSMRPGADLAVIEGAIVLRLKPDARSQVQAP